VEVEAWGEAPEPQLSRRLGRCSVVSLARAGALLSLPPARHGRSPRSMATLGPWLHPQARPPLGAHSPPSWRYWCSHGAVFNMKLPVSLSLVTIHHTERPQPLLGLLAPVPRSGAPGPTGTCRVFFFLCSCWHDVPGTVPGRWHRQLVVTGWGRRLDEHRAGAEPGAAGPCALQGVPVPRAQHQQHPGFWWAS